MGVLSKADIARVGTDPVPTEPYWSEDYFAQEREHVFRRVWLYAGREVNLPKPGDFIVKDIPACHASVLITRADDGQLRAFHNVCSHRSAKVVWEPKGHASRFVCKYHGWGYGLKGDLRNVPDEPNFFGLDRSKCGLTPVALDTSNGFIFLNLDPNPRQTLKEFLHGIDARLDQHAFGEWTEYYEVQADIPVNWKCIIDNFQETYHLSFVHSISVGDRSVGPGNPLGHPLGFELFGPHRMMGIWGNLDHKPAAVESFAIQNGGVISQGATDFAKRDASRHPNWQMDVHGIFPNVLIDVTPSFFLTHEVMPLTASLTRWTTAVYFPPAKTAGQRISQEYSVAAYRDTAAEDLAVLRTQQESMLSGAKRAFHFQANEVLCRHLGASVDQYVRNKGPGAAAAA
ncbi:MAG: aromatic ring-hydroxylating dioxygenase subunit alpha [Steroidobacteraceae bacterium]